MKNGDLSNEGPSRWMVTLDAVMRDGKGLPTKKPVLSSWAKVARATDMDPMRLGKLWQAANRYGLQFELVVFGMPEEYAESIEEQVDRFGLSPIRWVSAWVRRKELVEALAYRPDVRAVVDTNEYVLTWGSRGVRLADL